GRYWVLDGVFFFQAEDGIRDFHVTGVQTCALPISSPSPASARGPPTSSPCAPSATPTPSCPPTSASAAPPATWACPPHRPPSPPARRPGGPGGPTRSSTCGRRTATRSTSSRYEPVRARMGPYEPGMSTGE